MKELSTSSLLTKMAELIIDNPGVKVYVKWTCPKCAERITSTEPNKFREGGYIHEERNDGSYCGFLYTRSTWGLLVEYSR